VCRFAVCRLIVVTTSPYKAPPQVSGEKRRGAVGIGAVDVEGCLKPIVQPRRRQPAEYDHHDPADDHEVPVA
jgi:hypothetical protein